MSAEANTATLRRWVNSINQGAPAFAETFTPDARIHLVGHPEVQDRDSFSQVLMAVGAAFPGIQFIINEIRVVDDTVAFRWTARGMHRGELFGIAPTGREVEFQGAIIDRLADGRIVERWEMYDRLGLLQQLGAIPAADSQASTPARVAGT
jgi:predicted ester cyclase